MYVVRSLVISLVIDYVRFSLVLYSCSVSLFIYLVIDLVMYVRVYFCRSFVLLFYSYLFRHGIIYVFRSFVLPLFRSSIISFVRYLFHLCSFFLT